MSLIDMKNQAGMNPITEDDIANYLGNNPDFFERHAQVLATVQMTSPHGNRAVSLQERQAEMLREKIKGLEHRIMDMVRNSTENAAIAHKVHQWTGRLLQVRDPFDLPKAVVAGVRTLFDVTQADLNWENPAVRKEVFDMMNWGCEKGIDGFRMDVISMI